MSAAASAPLVVESAQNQSVRRVLAAAEDAGAVRQLSVVRITGGFEAPLEGSQARNALDGVPGLSDLAVVGVSFGEELLPSGTLWRSVVAPAAGGVEPLDRRLAAVDAPADVLVPVAASDAGPAPTAGGVWMDEEAAAELSVVPGDTVTVSITRAEATSTVELPVAGVYALAEDGVRPADLDGSTFFRDLTGRLPRGTGFGAAKPPLLTDAATLQEIAFDFQEEYGDEAVERILWSVEAGLDPTIPLLRADLFASVQA